MNELGIFLKTYSERHLDAALDAVVEAGLRLIQFNWQVAGLQAIPSHVPSETIDSARSAIERHGLSIAAVSGTFNMAHPDVVQRGSDLTRFRTLARATRKLGCRLITLCSGSRNPEDMWAWHPANASSEAWADFMRSLETVLDIAEAEDVVVAVEPEAANVVSSVAKARQMLDEAQSTKLGIVLDPANLVHAAELPELAGEVERAFRLLGPDIWLAHAKDISSQGFVAPGAGLVNFPRFVELLKQHAPSVPLLMHGFPSTEVPRATSYLLALLN